MPTKAFNTRHAVRATARLPLRAWLSSRAMYCSYRVAGGTRSMPRASQRTVCPVRSDGAFLESVYVATFLARARFLVFSLMCVPFPCIPYSSQYQEAKNQRYGTARGAGGAGAEPRSLPGAHVGPRARPPAEAGGEKRGSVVQRPSKIRFRQGVQKSFSLAQPQETRDKRKALSLFSAFLDPLTNPRICLQP